MANVLLIGSHPDLTAFAVRRLVAEGWTATGVVGPAAGIAAINEANEVDAVVLGGPLAMQAMPRIGRALREKHPFARIVVATGIDTLGSDILDAMGGDAV